MSDVEVTIRLPESLVERAQAAGVKLEDATELIVEVIERQIDRQVAIQRLLEIAESFDSLPDELKPTPEEIAAEIRAYNREQTEQASHRSAK